jgi:choice-of-anchor A domain-containing protein
VKKWSMLGLLAALLGCAAGVQADVISDWNLITAGDVTTSSEVDGSALIGGNLFGTSNYSVIAVTAPNGDGLAVGGNIVSGNIQVNNGGNFRIAGDVFGVVNLNGGGSQIDDAAVPQMAADAMDEVLGISNALDDLVANGTIDGGGNMNASPDLIDGQLVAVYELSQAALNGLGQLNLDFGSADSVIINFSGNANLVAPPNLIGGFNQANSSKILWNFNTATSILVNNTFNGAMLAPSADLQLLGGGINGSVAVDTISVMNAEIRRHNYTGHTPEPAGLLLLGLGALMVRRRR